MSRAEEIKQILVDKTEAVRVLSGEIFALKQELSKLVCPFKVGDRLRFPNGRDGVFEISKIHPASFMRNYGLSGRKIKKDGFPGKAEIDMRWYGEPALIKTDLPDSVED